MLIWSRAPQWVFIATAPAPGRPANGGSWAAVRGSFPSQFPPSLSLVPSPDAVIGSSWLYLFTFEGKEKGRKSHRSCAAGITTVATRFMSRRCRGRSSVHQSKECFAPRNPRSARAPAKIERLARCWWRWSEGRMQCRCRDAGRGCREVWMFLWTGEGRQILPAA